MSQIETKSKTSVKLKEPPMYKIIYMNDDQTSIEFVIGSLIEYFDYDAATAEKITMDIHGTGSAVVAVLPYELAEQKGIEVTLDARSQGFPLQVKVEAES
jgi:ATP-dependent Clp protease adaptor protein ClpS